MAETAKMGVDTKGTGGRDSIYPNFDEIWGGTLKNRKFLAKSRFLCGLWQQFRVPGGIKLSLATKSRPPTNSCGLGRNCQELSKKVEISPPVFLINP